MSRPIAYNASGPLSGSIRGGSVNYTVDIGDRDYTTFSSKKWVPSADGTAPIIFVTDSFTQGIHTAGNAVPLFYACNGTGSAAIIYTANRLPGSPGNYSDANAAISDLVTNRGYFIIESNDPYEGIDADAMVLDLDASKMSSYPQVGTSWRDLSGNSNTSTLTNGPVFNSLGVISFDNVDDYVQISSSLDLNALAATKNMTICFTAKKLFYGTGGNNTGDSMVLIGANNGYNTGFRITEINGGTPGTAFTGTPGYAFGAPPTANGISVTSPRTGKNTFSYVAFSQSGSSLLGFINGRFTTVTSANAYTPGVNNGAIGRDAGFGVGWFGGYIGNFQIYNRALSQAEILQNYYQAPIVTNGLVFAADAGNLVSYESGSTDTYSLTGSLSGSLINGVGFTNNNGGAWSFDGTDDKINFGNVLNFGTSDPFSVSVWFNNSKTLATTNDIYGLVNKYELNNLPGWTICLRGYSSGIMVRFSTTGTSGDVSLSNVTKEQMSDGNWHNITVTYDINDLCSVYVDGSLKGTQIFTNYDFTNTVPLSIGSFNNSNTYLNQDKISTTQIYNRALTASEILQNYQAEQYRFAGPQGIITSGLVVHLDAMNLESYPGTGNTWFDLSGNGNNATRNGATGNPTWNQTNGWNFYASVNGVNGGLTIANSATIQNLTATTVFLVVAMETKAVISGDSDWMAIYSKFASDQRIAISVNQVARYLHIEVPSATNSATIFNNADYTGTKFNIMAARIGASGTTGWLNGSQISTSANTTTGNTGAIYLGHDVDNEMFKGSMKAALTYNRALSDSEMGQVFTYLNSKFNVY